MVSVLFPCVHCGPVYLPVCYTGAAECSRSLSLRLRLQYPRCIGFGDVLQVRSLFPLTYELDNTNGHFPLP